MKKQTKPAQYFEPPVGTFYLNKSFFQCFKKYWKKTGFKIIKRA